jgi:hypothetical protein
MACLTEKIPIEYSELFERCVYDGVGDGWYPSLKKICDKIRETNMARPLDEQIIIVQVKEKFAGLRVYTYPADQELRSFIADVENETFHICEQCGAEGIETTKQGWRQVALCPDCLKKP